MDPQYVQVGIAPDLSRLDGPLKQPVGVAVSGGGDSLALLHLLHERLSRPLHVFCVDHGLNPHSAQWTRFVGEQARALGAAFTALKWEGTKPQTGLSAAARQARHALIADAARAVGVKVVCLAHTMDDVAEAAWMRERGSNVTAPRPWSPSPAWPQGRGVFLLRPLLEARREDLRSYLRVKGVEWIDDPANANPESLRVQARMADKPEGTAAGAAVSQPSAVSAYAYLGAVRLPVEVMASTLAMAAVSAGGGDRLPSAGKVDRALAMMRAAEVAGLSGARIAPYEEGLLVTRESGDIGRNRAAIVTISPGEEGMWDGRWSFRNTFEVPVTLLATKGQRARLSEKDQVFLRTLPTALRDTLPLAQVEGRGPSLIINRAYCWTQWRFEAAAGVFQTESDLI